MTNDPLSTEHFHHITVLEELVSSTNSARHFTFEPPENRDDLFDPYHPELGLNVCRWQVLLGDLGLLICEHKTGKLNKLFIACPDFVELFKEFETLKTLIIANGLKLTEPVACWIRGLIHAFMVENPNRVEVTAVMHATSSNRR